MRTLLHLTPSKNITSIRKRGLVRNKGRIWLMSATRLDFALIRHIAQHQEVAPYELVTCVVKLPSEYRLTECAGKFEGFYIAYEDIPPQYVS